MVANTLALHLGKASLIVIAKEAGEINKLLNHISNSVGLTCNCCRALAQTASSAPNIVTVLSPNVIQFSLPHI
jgi:hypothetical protein